MDIPAHRAAAVEPTPADTFELRELRDGKHEHVNVSTEERKRAESDQTEPTPPEVASPSPVAPPAEPASTKGRRASSIADAIASGIADAVTAPTPVKEA